MLGIAVDTYAQGTVRGRVLSAPDGESLQGVNITLNDTVRAITDGQGWFLFIHRGAATDMQLSLMGYAPSSIPIETKDTIHYLEPLRQIIEEVAVHTGYQRLPKERATGSFEHVDSALFHRQISTDVISRLDGIANSLLFDKRNGQLNPSTMSIRGLSTLTHGMTTPLVVVDNFPYEGDINNLNPNDVESVTLLKDAAAASIWGARAGNGVLVITTKKARFEGPPTLRVTASTSIQERPDLYYQPQMSPSDFIDVERFLFEQGAYNVRLNNRTNYPVVSPVVEILHLLENGEITESEAKEQIDDWRKFDVRDDLSRHFYRNAVRQQYNAALSGGSNRANYLVSLGHDRNANNEVGNGLSRTTIRINNQFRLLEGLRLETMVSFNNTRTEQNHPGTINLGTSVPLFPYARLADNGGHAVPLAKQYRTGFIDTAGNGQLLDWFYRPLAELGAADNTTTLNNAMFQLNTSYQILPSLGAEVRYQYQYQHTGQHNLQSEALWETRNTINRFTQLVDGQPVYAVPRGGILDQGQQTLQAQGLRGQLNYARHWGEWHDLTAIAGAELRDNARSGRAHRVWGYDTGTLTHTPVDLVTRHPLYGTLGGATNIVSRTSFTGYRDRFVSFYANAAYGFDRRYQVSASIRRDASNLFGVSVNNRWKPLWSVGAAYTLSNEGWYGLGILPLLKLRATYGYSGNVNNSTPAITTIQYAAFPSPLNRFPYANVNNPPNPELRWEQVATFNVGLDFGMRNDWLGGSIEYYRKRATDLMALVPWDPTAGVPSVMVNAANMETKGVDANLRFLPLSGKVRWESNLLLSFNKHVVTQHFQEWHPYMMPGNGGDLLPIEGRSAYEVISYRWAGLDPQTGDPMGYLGSQVSKDYQQLNWGSVTLDDLVFHGSALPTYFGAFRNTLAWRGISLSTNVAYRLGYYFRKNTIHFASLLGGNWNGHGDFYDRWLQPGDEHRTNVPSMVYPANNQRDDFYRDAEVNVLRGDHIRLQDLVIAYRLEDTVLKQQLGLKQISLSVQANNLSVFLWRANKAGIDPDFLDMPIPRSIALGVNLQF